MSIFKGDKLMSVITCFDILSEIKRVGFSFRINIHKNTRTSKSMKNKTSEKIPLQIQNLKTKCC